MIGSGNENEIGLLDDCEGKGDDKRDMRVNENASLLWFAEAMARG